MRIPVFELVKRRAEKENDSEEIILWFNVPYIGSTGENLIKAFRKKITRLLKTKKKIKIEKDITIEKLCFDQG